MPDQKPTLQEIAEMPFPASEQALKQWYGVEPYREASAPGKYRVTVEFERIVEDEDEFEVEAKDEEEAGDIARDECEKQHGRSIEITGTIVRGT